MTRLRKYVALYALLLLAATAIPYWRDADMFLFGWLNSIRPPDMAEKVVVVDVPYVKEHQEYRKQIALLLRKLAMLPKRPKAIVLDVVFKAGDSHGMDSLKEAIAALNSPADGKINVYAAVDPRRDDCFDPSFIKEHDEDLYQRVLSGYGHTLLNAAYGTLWYDPRLSVSDDTYHYMTCHEVLRTRSTSEPLAQKRAVLALPFRIAEDFALHSLPDIDQAILMKIGNRDRFKQHVYRFKAANESLRSSGFHPYTSAENWGAALGESELAVFHDAYVVVGSLDSDRPETIDRSGPELVAWALSDFVDRDPRSAREVWAAPALLALLVMIFSVLAAFTFRELFNRFIRVPPSIIALIAFLTTLTYLFLLVKGLLAWKHIYVQSALVVVAIAIACLLAWRYAKGLMHHGFWHGSDAFDIFISYANDPENLNWVTKHLYEPLIHVRKANGSRLRMFFDKRSIEPGDYWYSVLARAINGSRLFVAVYSADYFDRDGCRFEMMRAARKHLSQTDFIFPIARVIPVPKLPVEYDHIQFCAGSDAEALAECIEKIKRIVGAAGNDNVSRIASLENRAPLG